VIISFFIEGVDQRSNRILAKFPLKTRELALCFTDNSGAAAIVDHVGENLMAKHGFLVLFLDVEFLIKTQACLFPLSLAPALRPAAQRYDYPTW